MAENITPLMFSVSIEQLDKKLKDWTEKIANFANNGGKGYRLKIDFSEAESVIKQLKNLKIGDTSEIEKMQKEIDGLKKKLKELNDGAPIKTAVDNITKPLRRGADESKKVADDIEKTRKRVVDAYADMMKSVNALQMDRAHARGVGVDVSGYSNIIRDMKTFASEMSRLSSSQKFLGNTGAVSSMISQYKNYMEVIRMLRTEINNLSRSQREQSRTAEKQKLVDKRSVNVAIYQIALLEKKIAALQSLQSRANGLGVKTPNLDKLLNDMNGYMQKFANIYRNGGRLPDGTTSQMLKADGAYRALNARIAQNTQETRINIAARNTAAATVTWLAGEEMRLAQSISASTSAMSGQSQVMSELKSMALQYISLYGAKTFIDNIIEKGGQLEQQRLSIGAILGDTAHATDLFSKVKNLAVKSPFGVTELDQMTKQLSAFGFEYHELYDMTKRLADISAATGTDVSRLALALGHVRSETALTGYTLRQFSMANVPLLQKLADKMGVTTSQIRKMVSKKEIGYDDVLNVLKDLTNQGGPFYEAQETMSQALNAKFKNLRDSYEIMFNEIAESGAGGGLKNIAALLTDVSRHWQELFTVVGTGVAVFGGFRAYMALANSLLGANAVAVMSGIKAYQKAEVASLRLAESYRDITLAEKAMTATTHKWTMSERLAHTWIGRRLGLSRQLNDMQKFRISTTREQIVFGNALALSEKRQTTEDLARQVALGKMSKAQARQAIILSDLSKAEKNAGIAAVNSVRTYGRMTGVVNGVSMAFTKLGMAMKSMFLNPQMAVFALLAGVMALWQRNKQEIERAKELNDDLFNRAQEGIKNIRTMMQETGMAFKVGNVEVEVGDAKHILNGKFTYKPSAEMDSKDMIADIEKWTQFIKEYSAYPNRILNAAFKDENNNVRSIAEQYDMLAKSVSETAEAYVYLKQVSSAIEFAEKSTKEGLLRDDFITNINDYSNAVKKYNDSITELTVKHAQSVDKALAAARGEKTFAAALRAANADMVKNEKRYLTQAEQLKMLVENQDKYTDAIKAFEDARESMNKRDSKALEHVFHGAGAGWFGADGPDKFSSQMNDAFAEMDADATKWANSLKAKLTEAGWDFNNLTESQKQAISLAIAETVSKAGDAMEDIREKVKKLVSEKFGVNIDVKTIEAAARVVALEQSLKDLVGHDWHIDIKTATNFGDVISKIRQDYKAAQDYFVNVKPLMIRMGVDVSGGMKELGITQRTALVNQWKAENPGKDATIFENMLADYDSYAKVMNDALGFRKATGISLSDPNSGGKVFRDKHPHPKSSHTSDKELAAWRKRVQLLEKYRQELAQLEKIMTRQQAISKLKADGNFSPLWEYFSDPNDFSGSLDKVARILGTKGERKSFVEELGAKKGAEDLRIFKENVSNAVSELGRMADVMAENYETYKKWLELTGDSDLASRIAGVAQNSSMSGWLTDKMNEELRKSGDARSASDIFSMGESDVKKFGENSAIFKLWDEWQENNKKVKKENLDLYAEAIKNAKGYAEKVADINRELEREIAAIKEMTGGDVPTEAQQSQRTALIKNATDTANKKIADETWNNFKATEEWGRIFADLDRISTGTLTRMLAKLREIAPTLNGSVESTKAVYEAIDRVTNVVNGRNPFKAISESLGNRSALSGYYKQAKKEGNLVANAELSKLLGVKIGSTVTKDQIKDGMKNESEDFKKAIGKVVDGLQTFQNGLDLVSGVFDSLGMEGAANAAGDAAGVLGGAMQGASALSALGPWGMAAGAGLGLISGLFQLHDKRLERQIEKLREDVQSIEANTSLILQSRERTLGYDNGELRRSYAQQYLPNQVQKSVFANTISRNTYFGQGFSSKAQRDMYEYYLKNSNGTGYQQQLANLKTEREDYMQILEKQESKKKKSQSDIEETKAKIAELDNQIRHFAEDIANELWSIDMKGWADQFSDAFMTAFENGENMMKAFDDTAKSIMQSIVNEMLRLGIIEPMIDNLRGKLFGYTDDNGTFHSGVVSTDELVSDPVRASQKVLATMGEYFKPGGEGSQMTIAAQEFLTGIDRLMQQMGYSNGLRDSNSATLSSSVQGMTEETASILAGYFNAARQDLAILRILKETQYKEFVQNYWADYVAMISGIGTHVAGIHEDTQALVRMIERGDGALYNAIEQISHHFDNVVHGIEKVSVV